MMETQNGKSEAHKGVSDAAPIRVGGDTKRVKIIKEASELAHIPEIEKVLEEALENAKRIHADKIREFRQVKKVYERELGEKIETGFSKAKSYFFELTRVEDQEYEAGYRWELGKFKLNVGGHIIDMIFSDFLTGIDEYETAPNQIQVETVYSAPLNRSFQINFTKSSDTRVVGFVKILEENFVKTNNDNQLTVNTTSPKSVQLQKERVTEMMEDDPTFSEDITFYAHVKRRLY